MPSPDPKANNISAGRSHRPEQVFPATGWAHYARNGAAAQQQRRQSRMCPHHCQQWLTAIELSGGEGGIRTHVPVLPDHPISSRRRYDRFGTSPWRGWYSSVVIQAMRPTVRAIRRYTPQRAAVAASVLLLAACQQHSALEQIRARGE